MHEIAKNARRRVNECRTAAAKDRLSTSADCVASRKAGCERSAFSRVYSFVVTGVATVETAQGRATIQ